MGGFLVFWGIFGDLKKKIGREGKLQMLNKQIS